MDMSESTIRESLNKRVGDIMNETKAIDIHTHLFAPEMFPLLLSGSDNLLSYHYLIEEYFRNSRIKPADFWNLPIQSRAELIWKSLFVEHTPISEATSGVVEVMKRTGLNLRDDQTLENMRKKLSSTANAEYCDTIFEKAGLSHVVMTNDPFDSAEVKIWKAKSWKMNEKFLPSLRLDSLFGGKPELKDAIEISGLISSKRDEGEIKVYREYLIEWIRKVKPVYFAVSFSDDFTNASDDSRSKIMNDLVIPLCREFKIALTLMVGAKRGVNPDLKDGGDSVKKVDTDWISRLCRENSDVKFMVTALSSENQQELIVLSRKFSNLMVFGVWWFLNTESQIMDITVKRLELLGTSFIPQHSDSRILEQLLYKWPRARKMLQDLLTEKYLLLEELGWKVTDQEIERDVRNLLSWNFLKYTERDIY